MNVQIGDVIRYRYGVACFWVKLPGKYVLDHLGKVRVEVVGELWKVVR